MRDVKQETGGYPWRGSTVVTQAKRLKQQGELICLNDIIMNEKIWDIIY